MEGDDILLAEPQPEAEQPKKRDEWMTTLPPERKVRILSSSDRPPPLQFFSDRPAGRCFDWGSGPVIYLQGADRPIILASLLILIREILPRFHHFRLILTDPDPAQGRFLAQIFLIRLCSRMNLWPVGPRFSARRHDAVNGISQDRQGRARRRQRLDGQPARQGPQGETEVPPYRPEILI